MPTSNSTRDADATVPAGPVADRAGIVEKARVQLRSTYRDNPAGLTQQLAERHELDPDVAAEYVAEALTALEDGVRRSEPPHNTDAGNAARLVEAFGDRIRSLYEHRMWLAWDGKRWAPDATGAVERYAKRAVRQLYHKAASIDDDAARAKAVKFALAAENAARLDAMIRLARSDERIVVRADDLDADSWALNVENGTLDLRTGELRPHRSAEMHSKITSAAYEPERRSERWEAFLAEVLPDPDVRRFVQKLAGYSLTGEVGENVLAFPYGSGANGKSVFMGVLREVLGDYATEAAPDLLVARRERGIPVDVADLRGFRFVTTTEVEGGRRMATDVMKRITGESRLKARKMRQNYESFPNVTKLWMAANDRPQVDGLDEAIWRRVRLIPFEVTIPFERRDPYLIATLLEERDGILAWAVEGCLAWQRDGLQPPEAVMAATEEYREDSNPLRDWIESDCELEADAITPASVLRDSYEGWCRITRTRPLPRGNKWTAALERLGCSQPGSDGRAVIGGKQVRAWRGVRLRSKSSGGVPL
jgi:putative DNA primase/helicase